jgi:membrane-associated phospholipid phosphatase
MPPVLPSAPAAWYWHAITRLGEAQILLPALLALLLWFAWRLQAAAVARRWLLCVAAAAVLTTATKVAFIGWGVGWAALDFTGISGHAMFSAAVLPMLLHAAASAATPQRRRLAVVLGYSLAALVAVSRVMVQAHSASEALAGFALGSLASAFALAAPAPPVRQPAALAVGLLCWMLVTPATAPVSRTHDWVTRLSLAVSGHERPYTRHALHHRLRLHLPRWGEMRAPTPPTR